MATQAQALRLKIDREPVSMLALDSLSESHGLSAYDAAYLELALRRAMPMATLDPALLRAMQGCGVPLAEFGPAAGA